MYIDLINLKTKQDGFHKFQSCLTRLILIIFCIGIQFQSLKQEQELV